MWVPGWPTTQPEKRSGLHTPCCLPSPSLTFSRLCDRAALHPSHLMRPGGTSSLLLVPLVLAPMLLSRSSAFIARARPSAWHAGRSLGAKSQTQASQRAFFSAGARGLKSSLDFATRLERSEDIFGPGEQRKPWDYVAHHPGFEMVKSDVIKEYGSKVTLYRHRKTGAEVMSVSVDDDNKVFGITFRTPPEDSTGVPHILEHSVLCGSRKFPVKEPFVDMLKGSLHTYLNAFTYPDRTCYPVASQNTKDFYNLIHVYLDAVLHPRAVNDPLVLQQEGWHYELEKKDEPLTYKGVVYNEMKGVYSSPDQIMGRVTQNELFPDNTYAVDSGGDPLAIPNLTFDQFKSFHSRYYHPTNSRVYFYGNDDPMERLDLLDSYLQEFDKIDVQSQVQMQPKKKEPWRVTKPFPATEVTKDKGMVAVNWLVNDSPLSLKQQLTLGVLDHILMGSSASFLYKRLIESGLGESVIGGGLDDTLLQNTFSVGLKGVKKEDLLKVEQLVLQVLKDCVAEGFPQEAIDASVNSVEFSLREFNTGSFPRGLSFMLGAVNQWIYDRDPLDGLRFEKPLQELKADLASGGRVFEEAIEAFLLQNGHRVTVCMEPDVTLEEKQQKAETDKLAQIKAGMSDDDLEKVIEATARLKAAQEAEDSPEARATLPRLSLDDIDRQHKEIDVEISQERGVTILRHELPTNGIVYADIALPLSGLSLDDLPLVGLFLRCLLETGTSKLDQTQLTRKIGTHTGGIRMSSRIALKHPKNGVLGDATKGDQLTAHMFVRGKAVASKAGELFELMHAVLTDANLDNQKRVLEMLKEAKARYRSSVVGAGNQFASIRLSSRYSLAGLISEKSEGITYMKALDELIETAEKDWPTVRARLERIREAVVRKEGLLLNLTGDKDVLKEVLSPSYRFLDAMPSASTLNDAPSCVDWSSSASLSPPTNEGFSVPTQVNYVIKGGQLWKQGEKIPGSAMVVNNYLRNGYLWDTVRVIGGAYGGFSSFSRYSGIFSFGSYRDPNLAGTLSAYDKAGEHLLEAELNKAELQQAIIGSIGDLDGPMSPDQKGFTSLVEFISGETPEERQAWRDEVLSTSVEDFQEFGKRLIELRGRATTAVVGSKKALTEANETLPDKEKLSVVELL